MSGRSDDDEVVGRRLGDDEVTRLLAGVEAASDAARQAWPGPPPGRQPVQALYVPADRVTATTAQEMGAEAARLLATHAPDTDAFARVFDLEDPQLAATVRERVAAKLEREPVEDLRADFEDGYLGRPAEVEARDATAAAQAMGRAYLDGTLPPFVGLRIKSFADGQAQRSVATLDRFLGALVATAGELPDGFVVTFPKIVAVEHVTAFVDVLAGLERAHGLADGTLRFEAQIETTASVLDAQGRLVFRRLHEASAGRLAAAHVGVFDYTAGLGLPPDEQRLDHPALDLLRHLLQVSFAGTPVQLSDGSTNAVPAADTTDELHRVWRRHAADVRHSLRHGYIQGWDLHAAHLVSRYAVVFAHLLDGIDDVIDRLARWHGVASDAAAGDGGAFGTGAAEATAGRGTDGVAAGRGVTDGAAAGRGVTDGAAAGRGVTDGVAAGRGVTDGAATSGGVMDEPATIRRLEAHLRRALACGALDSGDVPSALQG